MRLSVQLYTLRDDLSADLEGTLKAVKEIGFEYVELAGLYGKTAEEWKALLDGVGLKASGAHIGIGELEGNLDGVIADAKTLGMPYVILPWIGEDRYGAGWDAFGKALEPIGEKLSGAGLGFLYHNHAFEFEGNGLGKFYAAADPSKVGAQLDLAWVQIGGGDPADWIKCMGARCPVVHLKDYDPSKDPQWVPGGEGTVDWDAVLAAAKDAGVKFGVIELDAYSGKPMDAVRASFEYFRSKGLS